MKPKYSLFSNVHIAFIFQSDCILYLVEFKDVIYEDMLHVLLMGYQRNDNNKLNEVTHTKHNGLIN